MLQNQLRARLPRAFLATLPRGVEISYAAITQVRALGEPLKGEVRAAFAGALEKLDRALALATQQVDLSSRLDTRIAMLKDEITLKKEMLGIVA